MREWPVIFSNPLALAIREGRKTQTRRLLAKPAANDRMAPTPWARVLPGERLWVKEQWTRLAVSGDYFYAADPLFNGLQADYRRNWKPARWMPRDAARTILTVTDVRHQRLQDITDEDIEAEGIAAGEPHQLPWGVPRWPATWMETRRAAFEAVWDSLHDKQDWASNPDVVALTFRLEPA